MECFKCELCKYTTNKKYNLRRHITSKHETKKNKYYKVCKCGKKYKTRHGYYKHVANCAKSLTTNEIINHNVTNNISNVNNVSNNISINLFLDKYCGNAKNLKDFVENLQYTLADVMLAHNKGYSNGITNVVLKGLQGLPPIERPIHCSNKKSGQLFIRDNDQWEEDNVKNKGKAYNIISGMRTKQYLALEEWEKEHPNWMRIESESLERCKIINNLLGENNEMEKNTQKILHSVAKSVSLDDVKDNI